MNMEAIVKLKSLMPSLKPDAVSFANSLVKQFEQKGKLSEKQWPWVVKLTEEAEAALVPDFRDKPEVGDFSKVIEFFAQAKKHLKYPAISLQLADGSPFVLKVAGPNSKHAGEVNMTDGKPFGSNIWYGRVNPAGELTLSRKGEEKQVEIEVLLQKLADDPARTAAAHGKLSGLCCFCNCKLTDEKSTAVGYGPTCAKKWNLPWGAKK